MEQTEASCNEPTNSELLRENGLGQGPVHGRVRTHVRAARRLYDKIPANRMGRVGIEPTTLGLKVPCSTN